MQCLINLETEQRSEAKMELIVLTSELMPGGKPNYTDVIRYPMIRDLVQAYGKKKMLAVLVLMVKDLCSSLNVVRNMNEDQMLEAASMLLDECGNFRLEDYVMMFSLGKRGQLVKIMDRIDLQMISDMMDAYWEKRKAAAEVLTESDARHYDTLGPVARTVDNYHPEDARLLQAGEGVSAAIQGLKEVLRSNDK